MENIDTQTQIDPDDHDLLLRHVIQGEHDLMFLDSYFGEMLRGGGGGSFVLDPPDEEIL